MKAFYLACAILGFVLPYWQFLPWLAENGLDLPALTQAMFATRVAAFAWLDVLVSAVVLLGFILADGPRLNMRLLWLPFLGTLAVGVSFGLPLFLLMRETRLGRAA